MLSAYIIELKKHLDEDDLLVQSNKIFELKSEFEDKLFNLESENQIKKLNAQEKGESIEEISFDDIKNEFKLLFKEFIVKRKKQLELKNTLENQNLIQKRELIKDLKSLVENEEKINVAFNNLKKIQNTWNKIGEIPRERRDETQREYSRLIELFFYNINIYKELKEHDFKRNLQLKEKVIFNLKQLRNNATELKQLETNLRLLQNEWEDIGPVQNEAWENLKNNYWETVRGIYDKINQYYAEVREQRKEIIKEKEGIIEKVKEINTSIKNNSTASHWNKQSKQILDLQSNWKKLGKGLKTDNERVWKAFRKECDYFFEAKNRFFESQKKDFLKAADLKKTIIEEARQISLLNDLQKMTIEIQSLQKKWKKIGFAGPKIDQKLWSEFRVICDAFFAQKEKNYLASKAESMEVINNRFTHINEFKAHDLGGTLKESLLIIYEFIRKYGELGAISSKDAQKSNDEFKKVVRNKLQAYDTDESLMHKLNFQIELAGVKDKNQRLGFIKAQKDTFRKKQDKIVLEINQLENNLGFFTNSSKSNSLLVQFETQIKDLKEQLDQVESVIKSIPNE